MRRLSKWETTCCRARLCSSSMSIRRCFTKGGHISSAIRTRRIPSLIASPSLSCKSWVSRGLLPSISILSKRVSSKSHSTGRVTSPTHRLPAHPMAYGKNLKGILKMRYTVSDAIAIEEHEGVGRTSTGGRVSLRPLRPDYAACLYAVYASTRTEELAVVDWDEAQKTAFLHMQFAAQHQFYQERYTQTD